MAKNWTALIGIILLAAMLVSGCGGVQAAVGDTVRVHYTGTLADGSVFDTSSDREPLEFTIGAGEVIEGFENAVLGMKVGETKTVTIPAAQAYPYREDLVFTMERSQLPQDIEVGQQLTLQSSGGAFRATVIEITETAVTLDANPPVAGKDLTFEIELVEIVP